MFNLPLTVLLLIGFTAAREYWVQENHQTGGGSLGYPAGCECSCDRRSSDRRRGSLGGSRRQRRRKKSRKHRRSRKSRSRDAIIDQEATQLPLESGSNLIQTNDVPLLSRDFGGVRMSDNIGIPEAPIINTRQGSAPLLPVRNSGQLGFAVGNTAITDNQGLIDGSTMDVMYDPYRFDNGVDNGFNYEFNGHGGRNEGTLIGDTAGFATDQNVDVRDRFTGDGFTSIGGIQDGGRGYGRHKSKYERSHRQRKRKHRY